MRKKSIVKLHMIYQLYSRFITFTTSKVDCHGIIRMMLFKLYVPIVIKKRMIEKKLKYMKQ